MTEFTKYLSLKLDKSEEVLKEIGLKLLKKGLVKEKFMDPIQNGLFVEHRAG